MSYIAKFNPTQEAVDAYRKRKVARYTVGEFENMKLTILVYCMENHNDDSTQVVAWNLNSYLIFLSNYIDFETSRLVLDSYDKEKSFSFRGWEYSDDSPHSFGDVLTVGTEALTVLAKVVHTPDIFEREAEFDKKMYRVKNEIERFCENMRNAKKHEVIDEFKEYQEKYEIDAL